jgi:DNA polymerase IV (DinB-like DNA polymerase)
VKIICCVDLDYFYAQCEEVLNPSIKDKPVVVCMFSGRGSEGGAVATCNYIARKYGVKSGMAIARAKKLLEGKEAYFLPARLELYEEISQRVMNIVKEYADQLEIISVDEAFLDVTQKSGGDFDKAVLLMQEMKNEIYEKEHLTCSVGISFSKVIAKIASGLKKPNGLVLVKPEDLQNIIWPLPVEEIPGIGPKTKEILNKLGIMTIGDLAKVNILTLIEIFGKKTATYLKLAAEGKDKEEIKEVEEAKQYSRMITLKENTLSMRDILPYIEALCKELSEALKKDKKLARGIGLTAILEDLSTLSKNKTLEEPTNEFEKIFEVSKSLLPELISKSNKLFRRISVRVFNLIDISGVKTLEEFIK